MSFVGMGVQRAWHLIDANNQTVGRLAVQVAQLLKGKHKPTFLPNKDIGDYVVIVNAEKIKFTGNKMKDKLYRWHTGYPGGLKQRRAEEQLKRRPLAILQSAILGMLRRNRLRHQTMEKRLKLYVGPNHPHTAQLPPATTVPLPPHPRKGPLNRFGLNSYTQLPRPHTINKRQVFDTEALMKELKNSSM
mmetsp:Transcript_23745/g.67113  ORF Transcript_23745/g.67113 Transcript_23745/m.67113 type:complete len:189 (-) Transcript_23745:39-605(-)|eukprot:CAMPEP_0119559904 /NCGR_PEP_ID=MMETSP1352-20130426/13552_1 /TAXON_ID=265584 /ORGANISM="Stauroneis constricta, Strain CCMP1120" /LENGTH=188 /DNA_ID=CAMNT_0007607725 /DNA_START=38 /DNA_END=604 /DNA_ORIENTATION=-